jgi:hypothetical protein
VAAGEAVDVGVGDVLTKWSNKINSALATTTSAREMLKLYVAATKEIPVDQYRKSDTFGHLWVCYARLLHRCARAQISFSIPF